MAGILRQQALDQPLDLLRDCWSFGELGLGMQDGLKDVLLLGRIKGRAAEEQLIEQDAKRIEVHLIGMARST